MIELEDDEDEEIYDFEKNFNKTKEKFTKILD